MAYKFIRIDLSDPYKVALPLGKHVIGRGKFLVDNADNNKVSRNHAELDVTADSVTVKSLHINPCFFIRNSTKEIQVLSQNNTITLNNGDQFGILPQSYWYELIYCSEENNRGDENINHVENRTETQIVENATDMNKLHEQAEICVDMNKPHEQVETGVEINKPQEQVETGVEMNEPHEQIETCLDMNKPHERIETSVDMNKPHEQVETCLDMDKPHEQVETCLDMNKPHEQVETGVEMNKPQEQVETGVEMNEPHEQVETCLDMNKPHEQVETCLDMNKPHEQVETCVEIDIIKKENVSINSDMNETAESGESQESISLLGNQSETQNYNLNSPLLVPSFDHGDGTRTPVKRPHNSQESIENGELKKARTDESNDSDSTEAGPSKQEKVSPKKEVKDEPSQSPAQPPTAQLRERCMYGANCYRKNIQHKAQFSHPQDLDWDDNQRQCHFGAGCRRRDPRHWRDYIHPPGVNPPNPNRPGMRVVERHGNIFYINANTVNFYDDHLQVEDSDGDSVDYDYEF